MANTTRLEVLPVGEESNGYDGVVLYHARCEPWLRKEYVRFRNNNNNGTNTVKLPVPIYQDKSLLAAIQQGLDDQAAKAPPLAPAVLLTVQGWDEVAQRRAEKGLDDTSCCGPHFYYYTCATTTCCLANPLTQTNMSEWMHVGDVGVMESARYLWNKTYKAQAKKNGHPKLVFSVSTETH